MEKDKFIESIFYNLEKPGSFSSAETLYKEVVNAKRFDISKSYIKKWLAKQEVYGLNKRIQRRFQRNRFVSYKTDYIWDADVCIMEKYAKSNKGCNNFL